MCVAKVGDTISDIKEGRNAGAFTVGVTEGSSQMGLSQAEFEALSPAEQDRERLMAREAFLAAGADAVTVPLAQPATCCSSASTSTPSSSAARQACRAR